MPREYHLREYPRTDEFPFLIGPTTVEGMFHEHTHDFIELVVLLEGKGLHIIEGTRYECRPGDVFVFHRGITHAFEHAHNLTMVNVSFSPALLSGLGKDVKSLRGFQSLFVLSPSSGTLFRCTLHLDSPSLRRLQRLLQATIDEYEKRARGYQTAIRGLLAQIVVVLSRSYDTAPATTTAGAGPALALAAVAAHIEDKIDNHHTIASMAAMAYMSRRSFIRHFTHAYGETPAQYILKKRLDRAAGLLRDRDARMSEVAAVCGFTDSNYFSRAFRKHAGMPPREFRKLALSLSR